MHPKERYEQIITSKLEALPLPNMADAIWARIEQQLDIDMPTNEDGNVPEPPAPSTGGSGLLVGVGMLAVIGAFIAFSHLQTPKPNSPFPTAQPQTIITQPDTTAATKNRISSTPPAPPGIAPAKSDNTALFAPPLDSGQTSIVATQSIPSTDSVAETSEALVQTQTPELSLPKNDSIPKKRKGVQNISNNDYRIVPKKDSLQ